MGPKRYSREEGVKMKPNPVMKRKEEWQQQEKERMEREEADKRAEQFQKRRRPSTLTEMLSREMSFERRRSTPTDTRVVGTGGSLGAQDAREDDLDGGEDENGGIVTNTSRDRSLTAPSTFIAPVAEGISRDAAT